VNEFLQQFLVESRELIEQASDGLLSLERSPRDSERLDAVFRAFHTLKGGAGIVEFPAMERAMHAAEDVLSNARSGTRPLTTELVGHCLTCLDRVLQWLDTLEETGELPSISAAQVDNVVSRFDITAAAPPRGSASTTSRTDESWVATLLERNPGASGEAVTAVKFTPDTDCFYRGEDPVGRMTALPGLLALELEPVSAWAPLDALDPFAANLVLTALTAATPGEVSAAMLGHIGQCEIRPIVADGVTANDTALPRHAREILEAQVALLAAMNPDNLVGRVGSAGLTSANVLRYCRRLDAAAMLTHETESSLREKSALPLRKALAVVLGLEPQAPAGATESPQRADVTARTLRVATERIDALARLTGELTVAKNSIGYAAGLAQTNQDSVAALLKNHHGVLERLVRELQRSVLGMRVLPLRSVLQRFPRVLREMSASLGKPVKLQVEGDDTEADKAIVEMLFEPLLHIVRNAMDHGFEPSDERVARGKPPAAVLRIRAARQGDRVQIEVSDDGRGIDVDRVREVAKERGVVTEDALRVMTEADVIDLVFAPGFSTVAKVTELSGRGVGMDAVRSAVERVGGRVSLESRRGYGTTVRLLLPFSVMMTHVMTVAAGEQLFGIPLDAVVETVRIAREAVKSVGVAQATVLRDRTIPVIDLARALGVSLERPAGTEAIIVVVAFAGQLGGIQVERLGDRMEVMLAPLEGLLSGTPGIAGTTLLGDGRVLLVLDVGELLQ
jgi:two-component system, chemotaxis family, sensor kinase CheA